MARRSGDSVARASKRIPDDPEEFQQTLVEHLDELRVRIIRSLVIVCAAWTISYYLFHNYYEFLNTQLIRQLPKNLDFKEPFPAFTGAFMLKFKLSFFVSLAVSSPFLIGQLWGFIKPGLKVSERKPFEIYAPASLILFLLGAFFSWLILPNAVHWFTTYMEDFPGASLYQEPGTLAMFAVKMLAAFGVGFQLPLVVYVLGRLGILTPETLTTYWRQAVSFIFVFAMIITPSNDPIAMMMMAIPMSVLFIISVYLVKWTVKPKAEIIEYEPPSVEG